ncbi:sterol desaturase/sphingolipid hydroxylase (fatty acid hydroxylase superfamily) [Pseudoduganella lurida]|uniref:Sterol desaturase/sphingolipid hydroxylase (Fatty acid hydroxylase superfamily) n=1 Tax=Pseudoduganella lurida TaxID=1036180 RepID=A0A562RBJ7_9BURK|nr:sterol desaturase family protein [Pseudoduganella lurida]TWI66425.1 sterol desaturase/sphingolipid hydroxylase (fatty acid hydroxylase superfamily) [Pseudoduganella lurida]
MVELYVLPIVGLAFVALFTREVIAPASRNHCDRRWLILASMTGAATVLVTLAAGYFFGTAISRVALVEAGRWLPDPLVGFLSFLVTSFLFYWWHRATHHSDWLWRVFHQLHHSARRVEALTAFYAHPLDTAAAICISGGVSYLLLGASPVAAAIALLLTGIFDLFLHSDVRTPRWLGYLIQRPEMHTVHHQLNHHAQNYGLPIWDLLFGTWVNPAERSVQLGFSGDKPERITDMLLFRDVHRKRKS